ADPHPGRGHVQPRRRERVHDPAGPRRADARPYRPGHRAPPGHRAQRRPHRGRARGPDRRDRSPRRAAGARRPVPPPVRAADGRGRRVVRVAVALLALTGALAAPPAEAWNEAAWNDAYDPVSATRFIPVELWTGGDWDGARER